MNTKWTDTRDQVTFVGVQLVISSILKNFLFIKYSSAQLYFYETDLIRDTRIKKYNGDKIERNLTTYDFYWHRRSSIRYFVTMFFRRFYPKRALDIQWPLTSEVTRYGQKCTKNISNYKITQRNTHSLNLYIMLF